MKSKNKVQNRKIYIFLFGENCFYIGATIQSMRSIYASNVALRNGWTARCFESAQLKNVLPQMFWLDTVVGNKYTAFRRQLAWAKLLIDHGYVCINGNKFIQHVELLEEDNDDYLSVKDADLVGLLSKDKSLFPDYGNERKRHKDRKQISISFTAEEHAFITMKAHECGMTKANYIKQCCLNPNMIMLDTSALDEYTKELRSGINELNRIATNIYYMQQYFPADLKSIQEFTDTVTDHYRQILIVSGELTTQIIKSRKIRSSKPLRNKGES